MKTSGRMVMVRNRMKRVGGGVNMSRGFCALCLWG